MKRSRFFLPVNKTPRDIELLVWQIKEENPSGGISALRFIFGACGSFYLPLP